MRKVVLFSTRLVLEHFFLHLLSVLYPTSSTRPWEVVSLPSWNTDTKFEILSYSASCSFHCSKNGYLHSMLNNRDVFKANFSTKQQTSLFSTLPQILHFASLQFYLICRAWPIKSRRSVVFGKKRWCLASRKVGLNCESGRYENPLATVAVHLVLFTHTVTKLPVQVPSYYLYRFGKVLPEHWLSKEILGSCCGVLHFVDSYLELTNDKWHLLYAEIEDDKNTVLPSYVVMPFMYVYLRLCSLFIPHIIRDGA